MSWPPASAPQPPRTSLCAWSAAGPRCGGRCRSAAWGSCWMPTPTRPAPAGPPERHRPEGRELVRSSPASASERSSRRLDDHDSDRPVEVEPPLPVGPLIQVLDALSDGVLLVDGEWTVRYLNPAGARLLGYEVGELAGANLWIAMPGFGGSIFHGQLLHARGVAGPVTWSGFYPPAG